MKRITAEGITKTFRIGSKRKRSGLSTFVSLFSGREPRRNLRALDGVSFTVGAGEMLGIIGANGSGKSTLLRMIARIYEPDSGRIRISGRVIPMFNIRLVVQNRLTMRDQIHMTSALLGMGRSHIRRHFDTIVSFSGLEDYVDTKLYQFSSGMRQRLAFSVAVHCSPDILLLDEIMTVGDEGFRRKSVEKIKDLVGNGASAVFVSHALWMIKEFCGRALWLKDGRIEMEGAAGQVVERYRGTGDGTG